MRKTNGNFFHDFLLSAFNQTKPSSSGAPTPEEEKYSSRSSCRAWSSIASPCWEDEVPNRYLKKKKKNKFGQVWTRLDKFQHVFRYQLGTSSSQQGEAMQDHARKELLEEYFSSSGLGAPELECFVWLKADNQTKPSSSGASTPDEEKYSSRSSCRAWSSIASPCWEDDVPNRYLKTLKKFGQVWTCFGMFRQVATIFLKFVVCTHLNNFFINLKYRYLKTFSKSLDTFGLVLINSNIFFINLINFRQKFRHVWISLHQLEQWIQTEFLKRLDRFGTFFLINLIKQKFEQIWTNLVHLN